MYKRQQPFYEVVVVGDNSKEILKELHSFYIPNKLIAASQTESEQEVFKGRYSEENTLIYVCVNNACKLPVKTVEEALALIKK